MRVRVPVPKLRGPFFGGLYTKITVKELWGPKWTP